MYEYWLNNRDKRDGQGPGANRDQRCMRVRGYHAARKAVGPVSARTSARCVLARAQLEGSAQRASASSHRALKDAVAWRYLDFNPARTCVAATGIPQTQVMNVRLPGHCRSWPSGSGWRRGTGLPACGVLAATTGMRRSELAGVCIENIDLDGGTLEVFSTRVVVDGPHRG